MLNNNIFYHGITRKVIIGFGNLFSNIRIQRKKDGVVEQTIAVPIAYAPKEKWLVRIDQDPSLTNHTYTTLPRLSFEITGMNYDSSRKTNRMNTITCGDGSGSSVNKMYAPVPYNLDVSLYALTKTQEDGLQIIEQILPYFTPEYTLSIRAVPESNVVMDVPIIMNSVSVQDDYDGDFEQRRFVTYTLNFTLKVNMYGPVNSAGIINNASIGITDVETLAQTASYTSNGDPTTGTIIENWIDF